VIDVFQGYSKWWRAIAAILLQNRRFPPIRGTTETLSYAAEPHFTLSNRCREICDAEQ
jgi:hypothetical protein